MNLLRGFFRWIGDRIYSFFDGIYQRTQVTDDQDGSDEVR